MGTAKLVHIRCLVIGTKGHAATTVMLRHLVKIDKANVSVAFEDIALCEITVVESTLVHFSKLVQNP